MIENHLNQLLNWERLLTRAAAAKSLQSCPTLCDPMDCSLPDSSIHGIFQARVLEWGTIAFSVSIPTDTKFYPRTETLLSPCRTLPRTNIAVLAV